MAEFLMPPKMNNYQNKQRKVGFELEFSNIEIVNIIDVIQKSFDVSIHKENNFLYQLNSQYGNFIVELDFELLTKQKLKKELVQFFNDIGFELTPKNLSAVEKIIATLSKEIVPYEISTPPFSLDNISLVDAIVFGLNSHGAEGTKNRFYNAFGLHINPEVTSLEAKSILRYLRAFMILQEYIMQQAQIDLARKITPYIKPFKEEYIKHILNPLYKPSIETLIDDYIYFNPSRNRSLDMLPLFAYIDEERVRNKLPNEKIKPRPTFHYRLSNCLIGEKNWSVSQEWNRWIWVENLADNPTTLNQLCEEYLTHMNRLINFKTWQSKIEQWI
jgi:hypothetical protein